MSPSSTGDSPRSATAAAARPFPVPSSHTFNPEVPPPSLTSASNGTHPLKSPSATLKVQRTPSFNRDGILGAAQKARNMSQSSDPRPGSDTGNGLNKTPSEEGSNPLKRRNTDIGVDYPRRRATIAVRCCPLAAFSMLCFLFVFSQGVSHARKLTSFALLLRFPPSPVRSLPVTQVPLRWNKAQVQALYRAGCRVHLSRAGDQARRW